MTTAASSNVAKTEHRPAQEPDRLDPLEAGLAEADAADLPTRSTILARTLDGVVEELNALARQVEETR